MIEKKSLFWHFQAYWRTFRTIQLCSGILRALRHNETFIHIEPCSDILRTLCNACIYNSAILKNLTYFKPWASSKACETCKMIRHIQSPDIVRTGCSSSFKDIWGYSGILMHIQSHSEARNQGEGGNLHCLFCKNQKKYPDFGKKALIESIFGLNFPFKM